MKTKHYPTNPTPRELGFYFPAEFDKQKAIWLSWPHNVNSWPDGNDGDTELLKMLPDYAHFVNLISQNQKVCINVTDSGMKVAATHWLMKCEAQIPKLQNVEFYFHPTNDAWCRDHGPAFLVNNLKSEKAIVDWGFNAWGGKYPYDLDDQIPSRIAKELKLRVFKPGIILEGGSVDFNGRGTVITTQECLLNPNRNPGLKKNEVEQYLRDYCGVENILWLNRGIGGDDTNGHVDDLTRFVNPTTVITMYSEDKRTKDYRILEQNRQLLKNMKLEDGRSLQVVPIALPKRAFYKDQQLPESYANFLITNKVVIVPTFRDEKHDVQALDTLSSLFTDRKVIGIDSTNIIWGLGSFHCLSQQEPAV